MQYNHIFGPVPSRRLGISLGVDLVVHKICSLDCVYCECGKTTRLTCERKEYVKFKDVTKELDHFWQNNPDPDYITFSGSGEPTLNSELGRVIDYIKDNKPHINVAVLTNSTLFPDPGVRKELLRADLVIPSLDAVSPEAFGKINRPDNSIDIHQIILGIEAFAAEFKGKIWLEVLILPGFNDSPSDLLPLKDAIKKINPDRVQINTLDRPGTMADIQPASRAALENIIKTLDFDSIEIIAKADGNIKAGIIRDDVKEAILETIHRRPCTRDDLSKILGAEKKVLYAAIKGLELDGKIIAETQDRGVFYRTLKD
jgi:wyosine [tRNA(Phe)-imidazoG37] synthetase (radical SAM superfamily)